MAFKSWADSLARVSTILREMQAEGMKRDTTIAEQIALIDMQRELIKSYEITNANLKAELAACEAGNTPPPDPDPVPEPEPGTFWQGLATVWPTAATTGPRIPVVDAPGGNVSGLVKGKRFTSTVFPANGTVFEDCEFVGNGGWGIDGDGRMFTVVACRFTSSRGGPAAILGNATVINCDISGFEDGIKPQGRGWEIRGNFIHDLAGGSDAHNDGIQVLGGPETQGLIEQNDIAARDTSAVMVQGWQNEAGTGPSNVTVRHNRLRGADLPLRIEQECTNCGAYENLITRGVWGYFDLSGAAVHHGNIDVSGNPID